MDRAVDTLVSRGILREYDATGPQHLARISGLRGEELAGVPRMQQFGESSSPPVGSHVLFARMGGASDRAVILGIDSAAHGPRDLGAGHRAIFDAHGNMVSLVQSKIRIVSSGAIEIVAAGAMTIESASLTHNGKNIGSTHVHGGIIPGGANTLGPA